MEKSINQLMEWRFACKHFDSSRKIEKDVLKELMENARMSPSTFGIQAWKFIVITNEELKAKLAPVCYNQPQILESSALVFFCARTDVDGDDGVLNRYMLKSQKDFNTSDEKRDQFKSMLSGSISSRTPEEFKVWMQKQVYLPAMALILAAAEKGIDSCPMEGFNPQGVAEVLELPNFIHPTVLVSLGYRNMEQPKKTRFDFDEVVEIRA